MFVTMRYVRMVEESERFAVDVVELTFGKLVTYRPHGQNSHRLPAAVNR